MDKIKALRGTRDILPSEIGYWQWVESVAREVFSRSTFTEIRCPLLEETSLFQRGIGEATDVVGKEMYSFSSHSDKSITLRPEGTAGVVRAYIEHGLHSQGSVQRLWYTGPMFRYERPQAGRQRQFHQIGLELLGSASPRADVEVIAIAVDLLNTLGLKNLTLDINSVGAPEDRVQYRQALVDYFTPFYEQLDSDSQHRLSRNPLRILDSKDTVTQEIAQNAPSILDYLSDYSKKHFDRTQQLLSNLDIKYRINPKLVRGLDYYTHTAFEIQSSDLGAQATVCGGGRYDGLVSQLGGENTPAVGWAIGMERLIILLQKIKQVPNPPLNFYVVSRGEEAEDQALIITQKLRQQGLTVEIDLSGSAFGKQFKRADKSGAKFCIVIGESEATSNTVKLKNLATQEQFSLTHSELFTKASHL